MKNAIILLLSCFILGFAVPLYAQMRIFGKVSAEGRGISAATVRILSSGLTAKTDSLGNYQFIRVPAGPHQMKVSAIGFETGFADTGDPDTDAQEINIELSAVRNDLNEIVVTGTLKEVRRLESPVPVEVYNQQYFRKNPTPNIFEALQNVNGVRPQLNCNICNTGDIHINGLEGPYTMILIDGMPLVSSLSTVYGLSGIPNSLVEQIEIVKGPASSLYGSEAVGGLINIITKSPDKAPRVSADIFTTSYQEHNADLGFKVGLGKASALLTGINYFKYDHPVDRNHDQFTDVTLQDRISVFQKWNFSRKKKRVLGLGMRYVYEDRWGGDMRWRKDDRGGDQVYGESIFTERWELIGNYQLPFDEKLLFSFSYNDHRQDSRYGKVSYIAKQRIGFGQLTWDKTMGVHDLLVGAALRYSFYDDNTVATTSQNQVIDLKTWLPGAFLQDEITLNDRHKLLLGFRYDYNSQHGSIFTPRFAYKWSLDENNILRVNAGTGFRVVNLFTEDHAALTGARTVEIPDRLRPERSFNLNLNYLRKMYTSSDSFIGMEFSAFYTHFNNRIIGDFDVDPNKIVYNNLEGYAVSKGLSLNADLTLRGGIKLIAGITYQDVATINQGKKTQQILTERFSGTWALSYAIKPLKLSMDYTGNVYSPMRLPLLSPQDPRKPNSPFWSIQNIQFTYSGFYRVECYGGVKNLFDWTPNKGNPFLIAGANDPFDKQVRFGADGQVIATPQNPYALTFDPTYVYGPNQGSRVFFGIRYTIK